MSFRASSADAGGGPPASNITIGTSIITGGTNTRVLFDDNGVIGENAGLTFTKASGLLASTVLAVGGATIGTDAVAWTGTATGSGQLNAASFVPTGSTVPTNGLYLSGANQLSLATNSAARINITTAGFRAVSASGFDLSFSAASATVPTLIPNVSDTTTGIGAQASGNISIVTGAAEQVRYSTAAASVATVLWPSVFATGGTATTQFPALFVQPTGTTAVTTWSTSGTVFGVNAVSGFVGNFLDFHVAGASSLFSINQNGSVISSGSLNAGSGTTIGWATRGILSSPSAGSIQLGNTDAAAPVAQTLRVQSVVAGTAATSGANWTLIGSLPTGTGTSGDIIIQTGVKTGSGTTQGTATTALTIKGETQTVLIASGKQLQLGNTATTGLAAGVLAATTNATITLTDASGQVYRVPCII